MGKLMATFKALITRLIFSAHGVIAIWQVTQSKKNVTFWYLSSPIALLFIEGIFTIAIKKNQEWRWFCPSVFLYLCTVVPAIWLLELNKVEKRLRIKEETINFAAVRADFKDLNKLLGVKLKLPDIEVDAETWVTLIEQFLMLVLILGRWLLPKGDLTRDQLSQLLLVYIGTAADIIEFFDSFKENKIANEPLLVFLTLGIWSWSLLQFTIVLSATRSRKPRGGGTSSSTYDEESHSGGCCSCCSIDVWGIALNILLQDAPFLAFRLLIIIHYRIISYMNVFFTCKNTLVILLQLYRLYVVHYENKKNKKKKLQAERELQYRQSNDIYIISKRSKRDRKHRDRNEEDSDYEIVDKNPSKIPRKTKSRKDTGYSTASSQTPSKSHSTNLGTKKLNKMDSSNKEKKLNKDKEKNKSRNQRNVPKKQEIFSQHSESSDLEIINEKRPKQKKIIVTSSATSSNSSSE